MADPKRLVRASDVRRAGTRIRRGNGTSYGDQVPSDQIRAHLIESLCRDDWQGVVFCSAVLNLRMVEAEARGGKMRGIVPTPDAGATRDDVQAGERA